MAASSGLTNNNNNLGEVEREKEEEVEKIRFEEERFVRMTDTRKDKQKRKRRSLGTGLDNLDDVGDVQHLIDLGTGGGRGIDTEAGRSRGRGIEGGEALLNAVHSLSQQQPGGGPVGGDRKHRRAVPVEVEVEEEGVDVLEEFSLRKKRFLADKKHRYSPPPRFGGIVEELSGDGSSRKRGATYEIIKNKGLTPHRKKANRNPRVKKREMYDKKVKARRGQVREVGGGDLHYGGEVTGIKANIARSRIIK